MNAQAQPTIVSGAVSNVAELGKDEAWLQSWLKEEPARLGLGGLQMADADPVQDEDGNPAFLATDDERYFSVDVRLGEVDASHGFQVLDNWARNRVRHPDKSHVAVLVTENAGDRYRTTLETLAEHLPLVVIELAVWRGDKEAVIVPRVALASQDVDLTTTPAVAAAAATKADVRATAEASAEEANDERSSADSRPTTAHTDTWDAEGAETDGAETDAAETEVSDPWKLPRNDAARTENGSLAGITGS